MVASQIFLNDLMGSNGWFVIWNRLDQFQSELNDATKNREKLRGQLWNFISVYIIGIVCSNSWTRCCLAIFAALSTAKFIEVE